jgi:hypothetical protein
MYLATSKYIHLTCGTVKIAETYYHQWHLRVASSFEKTMFIPTRTSISFLRSTWKYSTLKSV